MAFKLLINNQSYSPQELLQENILAGEPEYIRTALAFVRQWQTHQQEFVVHTSGSTGVPKPITITRSRMQASARLTLQALDIIPGTPALLCIHPQYIGGKMMLVRAMEGGLPIRIVAPEANPFKHLPAAEQPLFTALVPLQLETVLEERDGLQILTRMKAVIVGGAAVSGTLEARVQQVTTPVFSTYGMTETVSHIALRQINGEKRKDYFTALPGIHISTDDRACLVIEGPVVEKKVITNDVVELLSEKSFRWLGRIDNIINSGGVKVQAERLEQIAAACLAEQGISRRVLAGGVPHHKLGQKVVLLLEGTPLPASIVQLLLLSLKAALPKYWEPKEILFLEKFVESDNGKIKRKETWAKL